MKNKNINNKYIVISILLNVFLLGIIIGSNRPMHRKWPMEHLRRGHGKGIMIVRQIFSRKDMRELKFMILPNMEKVSEYLLEEEVDIKKVRNEFALMEDQVLKLRKEKVETFLNRVENMPLEERKRIFERH